MNDVPVGEDEDEGMVKFLKVKLKFLKVKLKFLEVKSLFLEVIQQVVAIDLLGHQKRRQKNWTSGRSTQNLDTIKDGQ